MASHNESKAKDKKVSRILQVQELIDFYVLSEILEGPKYQFQLDDDMARKHFEGVGVNISYLSRRIAFMREEGFLEQYWDDDVKRGRRYCRITDRGRDYLKLMLRDIPGKVSDALKFYNNLNRYLKKFSKMNTM